MKRYSPLITAGLLALAVPAMAQDEKVTLRTVDYDEMAAEINKHRGKVVVVEVWYPQ